MATDERSAQQVFEPLVEAGEAELQRSWPDLAVSGFIAGLDIGFGPLAMAVVAGRMHESFGLNVHQAIFLGSFLYPLGFIFVVMGRSELFTENTLTPVAGLLAGEGNVPKLLRRWTAVLTCNVVGTVVFSLFAAHVGQVFATAYKPIYRAMGMELVSHSFLQAVLAGVFGGWLVALMSWLVESSKNVVARILFIYITTYLLVALQLYHCIIGSIEVLLGMLAGAPIDVLRWLTAFLLPAVIGNTLGGVILVTALKGYQSRSRGKGHASSGS